MMPIECLLTSLIFIFLEVAYIQKQQLCLILPDDADIAMAHFGMSNKMRTICMPTFPYSGLLGTFERKF